MIDTRNIQEKTMSKKYMWQLKAEVNDYIFNNSGYFYCPYVPIMKTGVINYDAV